MNLLGSNDCLSLSLPASQVDEEELRKQREEVTAIVKMRVAGTASGTQVKDRPWGGRLRPAACTTSLASSRALSPHSMLVTSSVQCTWRRKRQILSSISR